MINKLIFVFIITILFYCYLLLFVYSIIVTSKQFFGDPIECDAGHASGMIDKDVLGK